MISNSIHRGGGKIISTDPYYYSNVTLLLHMDGGSGTNFIDDGPKNYEITSGGAAMTNFGIFGGSCANTIQGDGSIRLNTYDPVNFGTGDFTFECWFYNIGNNAARPIISSGPNGLLILFVYNSGVDKHVMYFGSYGVFQVQCTVGNVAPYAWYHLAVTRQNNVWRLFINGILDTSVTNSSNLSGTYGLWVAADPAGGYYQFSGYIDELRITKGFSRYNSNFTVPTQAFSPP